MKTMTNAILWVAAALTLGQQHLAGGQLWDREPTLWEAAKAYKLVRPLPDKFGVEGPTMPKGPQGINLSNGDCVATAKWLWKTAILASTILNTDADKRAKWQQFLDKMAPYYRMPDGTYGGIVVNGVVEQHKWMQHFPINVTDEFNLDLPPAERDRAFNSCKGVEVLNADVAHLLGKNPDQWTGDCGFSRHPWLMYYATRHLAEEFTKPMPLDTPLKKAVACWLEPERLCNSRSGTIYLFPCVPSNFDVAFRHMQARGGFLVSGELRGGQVSCASIKARRTDECRVMNPWPGKQLEIHELPGKKLIQATKDKDSERYRFAAVAGREYGLSTKP